MSSTAADSGPGKNGRSAEKPALAAVRIGTTMRTELERVLALNKVWQAITTISVREALKIVFRGRGRIIDPETYQLYTWEEWCVAKSVPVDAMVDENHYLRSQHVFIRKPEVIVLGKFAGFPNKGLPFSRRGIYERDNFQCQYCGKFVSRKSATIDHVLPVSRGGKTTWLNCTTSCMPCNQRKADRTPDQAGLRLKQDPFRPTKQQLLLKGVKMLDSWKAFLTADQIEQYVEVG